MIFRRTYRRYCVGLAALLMLAGVAFQSSRAGSVPPTSNEDGEEILTFSTVGDSRQDPVSPDPTTLPLSGQDAIWL